MGLTDDFVAVWQDHLATSADPPALALGAWWAMVAACADDDAEQQRHLACAAAADAVLGAVVEDLPDPERWAAAEGHERDAGYQLARALLPPTAPGPATAPSQLPGWAAELRRGDGG